MKNLKLLFLFLSLFIFSCGKDNLSGGSQSSSSSAQVSSSSNNVCKTANGGKLRGCCSYHGGAKNCAVGAYLFNSSNSLICNDGSISPTCTGDN